MDMSPEPTITVLNAIQQPMDEWRADWTRLSAAIRQDEVAAKTGFDDVSKQFRDTYNAIEPHLTTRANNVAPRVVEVVGTGREIVAHYLATFAAATDVLRQPRQ
jgi:hypothetical protein